MDSNATSTFTLDGRFRLFPLAPLLPPPKKEYKLTPEPADTEFRKEFPPDPSIGSELDETARVWKVYRREAEAVDKALLQGWSETLDILLIFAGLFSAVATAFVIESYQFLQLDNTAYSAVALYILVTASHHSTGMTLPSPPDLGFKSPLSRLINGLWFTSILLSLAVALLAILAKQWITEYRARNNASVENPRQWVRRREVYFQALTSWPVAKVVAFLPFLLHLSLFLFFAGVVAFLWTLDQAIGIWIIVLGGFLGVFYMACTLVPLWIPESPTSTPLLRQMRTVVLVLVLYTLKLCLSTLETIQSFIAAVSRARNTTATRVRRAYRRRAYYLRLRMHTVGNQVSSFRGVQLVSSFVAGHCITCRRVVSPLPRHVQTAVQRIYSTRCIQLAVSLFAGLRATCGRTVSSLAHRLRPRQGIPLLRRTRNTRNTVTSLPLPAVAGPPVSDTRNCGLSQGLQPVIDCVAAMRHAIPGIQHLVQNPNDLDVSALQRLIVDVSDTDAVAIGLQAIGALRWDDPRAISLREHNVLSTFPEELAFTWSSSGRTSTEILRVIRSELCMRKSLGDPRPHLLDALDGLDYPDLALLFLRSDEHPDRTADWLDVSPSLASTALHALRSSKPLNLHALAVLSCCNLDKLSPTDWQLAVEAYSGRYYLPTEVPELPTPFNLAIHIGGLFPPPSDSTERENVWADHFLVRLLDPVRAQDWAVADTRSLLSSDALRFLASERFHGLPLRKGILELLSRCFQSEADIVMRSADRRLDLVLVKRFWSALACFLHVVLREAESVEDPFAISMITVSADICLNTLRNWQKFGSRPIRAAALSSMLLSPLSASQSLWRSLRSKRSWSKPPLDISDALASCLGLHSRGEEHPSAGTSYCIDAFFAELSYDDLEFYREDFAEDAEEWLSESKRLANEELLAHFFQHCAELRPGWWLGILSDKQNALEELKRSRRFVDEVQARTIATMLQINAAATNRGPCQSCPASLGYPESNTLSIGDPSAVPKNVTRAYSDDE